MSNTDYRKQCDWCGRRSSDGVVGTKSEHGKNYKSAEWFCSQKCLHEYPYSLKWKRNRGIKSGCSLILGSLFVAGLSALFFSVEGTFATVLGIGLGLWALAGIRAAFKGLNF